MQLDTWCDSLSFNLNRMVVGIEGVEFLAANAGWPWEETSPEVDSKGRLSFNLLNYQVFI